VSREFEADNHNDLIRRYGTLVIALLAVAASITGIWNTFAYDDIAVIVEDTRFRAIQSIWQVFTHTYWMPQYGGSLYRPLTTLGFALQWLVGGGSPLPFHIVSIALYAAVSAAVFGLAKQLFDDTTAFLAAAIFAVHPVHVEAVANAVGQAELGAALLVVVAASRYIRWTRSGKLSGGRIFLLCVMFFGALLFKEHAIVLPALILAAELLPSFSQSAKERAKRLWPVLVSLAVAGAAFVVLRTVVIGNINGGGQQVSVLGGQPLSVRALTMTPVVLEWIRLFLWPANLSADYSPPRIDILKSFTVAMVPAIAIVIASCVIAVKSREEYPSAVFAFAWLAVTMLIPSNIIITTGFVLAERTLFLPSVGVAMLLGAGLVALARSASPSMRRALVYAVSLLIVAGIVRSSARNPVWRNNESLFRQTAEDVPNSSKAHEMLGDILMSQGKREGIIEMTLGVKLASATDVSARHFAARRFHRSRMQATALPLYQEALALDPSNSQIREEESYCLAQMGRLEEAVAVAKEGLRMNPGDPAMLRFLSFANTASVAEKPLIVASSR
jgi:hypothetical protein